MLLLFGPLVLTEPPGSDIFGGGVYEGRYDLAKVTTRRHMIDTIMLALLPGPSLRPLWPRLPRSYLR